MNQPIEEKCRKVAEKIVDLTGYGQALHVNDILPDLRELAENLLEQERKRMSDIERVLERHISWKPTEGHGSEEELGFQKGLMAEAKLIKKEILAIIHPAVEEMPQMKGTLEALDDTHTVKEEKYYPCTCGRGGAIHDLDCLCNRIKEEPTTPLKHSPFVGGQYKEGAPIINQSSKKFLEENGVDTSGMNIMKDILSAPKKECCNVCGGSGIIGVMPKDWRDGADYEVAKCPDCHQEKLPTSSYEVTCGRCEKSIKHSCGRV